MAWAQVPVITLPPTYHKNLIDIIHASLLQNPKYQSRCSRMDWPPFAIGHIVKFVGPKIAKSARFPGLR